MRALPMAVSAASHGQPTPPTASQVSTSKAQMQAQMPRRHHRWKWRCTVLSSPKRTGS
jgi:hypothetical protein